MPQMKDIHKSKDKDMDERAKRALNRGQVFRMYGEEEKSGKLARIVKKI